jgi:hypothetical protein
MGVYINTFRTSHKMAEFNGQRIKVYAFKYLCLLQDADDHWGERKRRAALMQSNMEQARAKFEEHKPAFIGLVHEDDWEDAVIHSDPKAGVWYDTEGIPAGPVIGFLKLKEGRRKWFISLERRGEDFPFALGTRFTRRYIERVVNGEIVRTNLLYIAPNAVQMTEEQFLKWKELNEPDYLAACQRYMDEQKRLETEAAAARKARADAKDSEIAAATQHLQQLQRERASV